MKKTDLKTVRENKILLNILTPISGIEYKTNRMRIGDTFAKIYTIVKYPQNVSIGWLSKITNIQILLVHKFLSLQIILYCLKIYLKE